MCIRDSKQAEQEKNVAATQKKVDELNAQQAEAQNVVDVYKRQGIRVRGNPCRICVTEMTG